jgi:hypothetical protein
MPALAALSIYDGATTPAAHTFAPVTSNGAKAEWADRSSTTPAGYRTFSNEVRKPATPQAAYRNLNTFYLPVEATVDGQVKVVGYNLVKIEFNFRQESTDQERKDAVAYAGNALALSTIKNAVIANEPHW